MKFMHTFYLFVLSDDEGDNEWMLNQQSKMMAESTYLWFIKHHNKLLAFKSNYK